jgi:HK97 family phage prohead protease
MTTSASAHVRRLRGRVARTAARFVEHAARTGVGVDGLAAAKLPWYEVRNAAQGGLAEPADPATVFIFDEIGGSFGVSADDFARELQAIDAPTIRVRINSPGGSVFDAVAIYNALNHHPAHIEVYVDSLAASAATIIAMAGDEIVMMPGSQMMIHDAAMMQDGNAAEMAKASIFLDRQSDNIADIYRMRAGGDVPEWRDLMLAETWMFAREAVSMGLADRVEEPPAAPDSDPELAETMRRAFDLSQFRYAGRRDAPAPERRTTPAARQQRVEQVPTSSPSSGEPERRRAARQRLDAGGRSTARAMRTAPTGLGTARMAAFPAKLRAELVDHNGQQRYHLIGHASVVNAPYEMWDSFGPYMEVIDGGAFTRTLNARPDVAFLVNHRGVTMARTTNDTLKLSMDDVGLAVEAWLNPKRQDVSDLVVAVQDRDVTEMSFAFMLADGGGVWSSDFETFRITDLDLDRGDVSAVNYGANPYTDVAARSGEILADLDHLPAGAARAAVERLQRRGDISAIETALACDLPAERPEPPRTRGRSLAHIEALLDV